MNKLVILLIIAIILVYKFYYFPDIIKKKAQLVLMEEEPSIDEQNVENNITGNKSSEPLALADSQNIKILNPLALGHEFVEENDENDIDFEINNTNVISDDSEDNIEQFISGYSDSDDEDLFQSDDSGKYNIFCSEPLPVYGKKLLNIDEDSDDPDNMACYDAQNDILREIEEYEQEAELFDGSQKSYWDSLKISDYTNRSSNNKQICQINKYKNNNDQYVGKTISEVYDSLTEGTSNKSILRHDDKSLMNEENVPDAIYGMSVKNKFRL